MKRAISTLESTVITIGVMLLKEVILDDNDAFDDEIANLLHAARNSLEGAENSPVFISVWTSFCTHVDEMIMKESRRDKRDHNEPKQQNKAFPGCPSACLTNR